MNVSTIHSKAVFIATLNPKAWEVVGGGPGGKFAFSDAHIELLVADVVKSVGATLSDRKLGKKVYDLSRKMATQASQALVSSWEPGDELCPPWRWPWPGPWPLKDLLNDPEPEPWKQLGPTPNPWMEISSAEKVGLAYVLTQLSGLTTSKEFNQALKGVAMEIATDAAKTMADDFERCGTVPRKPFPKPHSGAADDPAVTSAIAGKEAAVKTV
jgi:hypothetical protein